MRRALCISFSLAALAQPAWAQTRIYVSGDLFAEAPRFSRSTMSPDTFGTSDITVPPDSVAIGGGGRIGAFLSPEWSVELGVDIGQKFDNTKTTTISGVPGITPLPPSQTFTSETTNRYSATSVLLGYHPPASGRVHAGFRGGLSFMHRTSSYMNPTVSESSAFPSVSTSFPPQLVTVITVTSTEYDNTLNVLTATVGAEAAVDVSHHFAIVPEIRVHAGGIGAILIRPGVSARWRF
jgi:Outer membrane protein beta-barrel domain